MKKISWWAKSHIWQSRLLIIQMYILLNIIGIAAGKLLNDLQVIIPQFYFVACIIFTIPLWILYPHRRKVKKDVNSSTLYARRKLFDFCLAAVTFLMIIYAGNNWENLFVPGGSVHAFNVTHLSKDSTLYKHPLIKNFITHIKGLDVSKLSQREKIKLIKNQLKAIKHDDDTTRTEKALLITLSVIVAIALIFGVAALSCSLSCSGSEALAVLVGIGGVALVIILLVHVIKRINNPHFKKKKD